MRALYPDDLLKTSRGEIYPVKKTENEALIWEDFKKGSQSALTYIYRHYANPLFNYGCQFSSNHELVKDAVQDLFTEIIHNRSRLGKTTSIKFYLFKSLRNKLVRLLKKPNNRLLGEDAIKPDAFEVVLSPEHLLIHNQLNEDTRKLLEDKINELPALQKEALLLYFYEGMGYDQISGILAIKTKSARALIYRAIESLGKLVKPFRDKFWWLLCCLEMF